MKVIIPLFLILSLHTHAEENYLSDFEKCNKELLATQFAARIDQFSVSNDKTDFDEAKKSLAVILGKLASLVSSNRLVTQNSKDQMCKNSEETLNKFIIDKKLSNSNCPSDKKEIIQKAIVSTIRSPKLLLVQDEDIESFKKDLKSLQDSIASKKCDVPLLSLNPLANPPADIPKVSTTNNTQSETPTAESCKSAVLPEILKLFQDDKKEILKKQFQVTAAKTALFLKNQTAKNNRAMLWEDYINKEQEELSKEPTIAAAKKLYLDHGFAEDKIGSVNVKENMKNKTYNYYSAKSRFYNEDASKFYMLMKGSGASSNGITFSVEDSAIAWIYKEMAQEKKLNIGDGDMNRMSLSVHVNKYLEPAIAGGKAVTEDELKDIMNTNSASIDEDIKTVMKTTKECVGLDSDPCYVDELKVLMFTKDIKDILLKTQDKDKTIIDFIQPSEAEKKEIDKKIADSKKGPQRKIASPVPRQKPRFESKLESIQDSLKVKGIVGGQCKVGVKVSEVSDGKPVTVSFSAVDGNGKQKNFAYTVNAAPVTEQAQNGTVLQIEQWFNSRLKQYSNTFNCSPKLPYKMGEGYKRSSDINKKDPFSF